MRVTLIEGATYDVSKLRLLSWTRGDGTSTHDYSFIYWFDLDTGRYMGPDQHGIEPIVEEVTRLQ